MNKTISRLMILIGFLLIAAAIVLVVVIVPGQRVFPADVDAIRDFDVAYLTLLNPDTLEFFVAPPGEADYVVIRRHVAVQEVKGQDVLLWEGQSILNGQEVLEELDFFYALDRKSMEQIEDVPAEWAELDGFWEREGLVVNWNVDGVRRANYVGWNEDTRRPVTLVYQGESEVDGMNAYYFTSEESPQPIHPDQVRVLGLLPELTMDQLVALARTIEVEDPAMRALLPVLLPRMVEAAVRETQNIPADQEEITIPLEFYYDYHGEYWVEPTTGVLLNTVKYEHRAATFPAEIVEHLAQSVEAFGMDAEVVTGLLPVTVSEFEYTGSPEAIAAAKHDAQEAIDQLSLYGTTLPLVLVIVGGILIVAGVYFYLRGQPPLLTTTR